MRVHRCLPVLVLSTNLFLTACSVLDKPGDAIAIETLSGWRARSAAITVASPDGTKKAYERARAAVNALIDAKIAEVTIAGSQLFSSVDLLKPEAAWDAARNQVDALPQERGVVDQITIDLIVKLLAALGDSRRSEASAACAKLEAFKWPALTK